MIRTSFPLKLPMTSQMESTWYIERDVPFCNPFLCQPKTNETTVALWECMPSECKRKLEVVIALLSMLAFFTTIFNIMALVASLSSNTRRLLHRNPTMLNYSTYVVSMAVADLLVGAVVLPLITAYFYLNVTAPRQLNTNYTESYHAIITHNSTAQDIVGNNTEVNVTGDQGVLIGSNLATNNNIFTLECEDKSSLEALKTCVGVLTHLTIFVSLFTLASASADRFYTSTNPISHKSIKFSGSRLSRINSLKFPKFRPAKINRSTFFVIFIWILGLVFSLTPLGLSPVVKYETVGHIFVFLSSTEIYTSILMCYVVFLSLPLLVTWLFSFLICLTLWRRKRRLRSAHSSKSSLHKASRRKISETNRPHPSMSESRVMSDVKDTEGYPMVFEDDSSQVRTSDSPPTPIVERPLLDRKKRRPSSFDATLLPQVEQLMKLKNARGNSLEDETAPNVAVEDSIKSSASFVAMRLLYRRSWSGIVEESGLVAKSSLDVRRKIPQTPSPRPLRNSDSPIPSLPMHNSLGDSKGDISRPPVRRANRMQRRRSSVYRARELLKSKSFETNIAKTLIAVVVTITLAVLPLLTVMIRMSTYSDTQYLRSDVTTFVVAVIILFSNSFWNFVIYGARMPYFRQSVLRIARRSMRRLKGLTCSLKLSLFCRNLTRKVGKRDDYEIRNTSTEMRGCRREMFVVRSCDGRNKKSRMTV